MILKLSIILFTLIVSVYSQTCGFGCLGLSGVYGGYSVQEYSADGINSYLKKELSEEGVPDNRIPEFSRSEGFVVGSNIFRADFDDYFFTVKGYYKFLKEKEDVQLASATSRNEYELTLNHWGFGVDFGIPLFSLFEWKIIDGGVAIFNSNFRTKQYVNNNLLNDFKNPAETEVGYYIGTGIIVNIVKNYLSLEGTAGYSKINIKNYSEGIVVDDAELFSPESTGAINNGGVVGTIQLNVGFPL